MAEPAIPTEISEWMNARDWGTHHLIWHLTRIWDLLPDDAREWAQQNGGSRANRQEGQAGNGMDFLAMHRVMIRQLTQKFSAHGSLFAGWAQPPTNPDDANDPMPANGEPRPFSVNMSASITRLHNNIADFQSDDDLGLFMQTRLRPVPSDPRRLSSDPTTGIHNYLHNRFSDENSNIDMGSPLVNLHNQRFWRLHGWIDNRWTAFRTAKTLPENEPAYQQALAAAAQHMRDHHGPHPHALSTEVATEDFRASIPEAGRHFFRLVESLSRE